MTDDEMKAVFADMNMSNMPDDIMKAVSAYMGSEEGGRYICGEQFDRDWAAFEARVERELVSDTEAAAMFNNMPIDVFKFILAAQLAVKAEELRLTDAVPPTPAVN